MARLTLCMIVKDEEAMLAGCLASVRGVVDDMVVVDTGSRDATPEIARKAGARVVSFAWCDDFAAARNEALRHARGDWVLALDADERLAQGAEKRLRQTLGRAKFDCGMVRLHDATRAEARTEDILAGRERQGEVQLVARLLRRTPDLTYVDSIHENVMPWLRRRGMHVGGVDLDIIHLGATKEVVGAKAKVERNVRLLRARLERDSTDVVAYGYLANEYLRSGALEDALAATEGGWPHVARAPERDASIHRLALARAYLMIAHRRFAESRETVRVARAYEGNNPDFSFLDAFAWEGQARHAADPGARTAALENARSGYAECLTFAGRIFAQSFVCGASTWMGQIRLGTVELLLDHPDRALGAFDDALAIRPAEQEALLGRAEAMIGLGDARGALLRINGLLDRSPDAWTLAAAAVQALGMPKDVALFTARACALLPNGFLAPHRRHRLRALQETLRGPPDPPHPPDRPDGTPRPDASDESYEASDHECRTGVRSRSLPSVAALER
jgi:glycosyltransferase involved in cell wall biosynthesis